MRTIRRYAPFATKEIIDGCALAHGHLRSVAVLISYLANGGLPQKLVRRVFSESRFKLCLNRQASSAEPCAGAFCVAITRPVKSNDNENS